LSLPSPPSPKTPLQRWRSLCAEQGSLGLALLYVLHRALQRALGERAAIVPYRLVAQPVGNPQLADVRPDPQTVVRRVGPDDEAQAVLPRPAEVKAARWAAGAECHAAWVKGGFAGTIWIARGSYVEDEVHCTYVIDDPVHGVWDFDVYVEPRLRLGRTMARLWKAVDDSLHAEGVRWSYSRINRFNTASLKAHERLGAVPVGGALFITLGPLQLALLRQWPFVHLRLGRGPGPRLRLRAPH
jgi:hypothetical protein